MSFRCSARRFGDPEFAAAAGGNPCHGHGAPLPLKAAAVGGAFWLFPPLGVAALALMLGRARRDRFEAPGASRGFRGWRRRGWSSGNAAFDAEQAATLQHMAEDAEAFADFRRREHEARDREVFERFKSERAAAPAASASEPPTAGGSAGEAPSA